MKTAGVRAAQHLVWPDGGEDGTRAHVPCFPQAGTGARPSGARRGNAAASTDGLVVSTRARFVFTAEAGTTGDARIRDITQALPPHWADRLFTARERAANEQQLQQIAADGLAQMYFRADNSRAHGLGVEFTDVERLDIEL